MRLISILCLIFFFSCGDGEKKADYEIAFDPTWLTLELPGRELQLREFSRELIQAIEKVAHVRIHLREANWDSLMPGLQKEKYDGVLTNLPSYLFYKQVYDFSDLYLATGPTLVMSVDSSPRSLEDLAGKEIGLIQGSSYSLILEKYDVIQRFYLTAPAALNAILLGEVDGVMLDILNAQAYCNNLFQGKLKVVFPPLNEDGLRLITLHGKQVDLIHRFNKGLKIIKENGTYEAIAKKWNFDAI